MSSTPLISLASVYLTMGASALLGADSPQLFNLNGAIGVPAFPLSTTKVWPTSEGEGHICLWAEDRFAALTITIDDNTAQDHDWWVQMAETYDIPITWFVITSWVNGSNPGVGGTWDEFQELVNDGHSVQSHTITHSLPASDDGYITEYEDSQSAINSNLTGQWAGTIAYPDPSGIPVRSDLAKDFFIGARGVVGTPNVANQINYMETKSTSSRIGVD